MNQAELGMMPTVSSSVESTRLHGVWLWLARGVWLAVTLLVCAILWEMVPANYRDTSSEWAISEGYAGVSNWMRFATWVRINVALETAAAAVSLASGLIIFWRRSDDWVALFISMTMLLVSILFISGNLDVLRVAGLDPGQNQAIRPLLPPLILLPFLLLSYLFPDGRFAPGWTRYVIVAFIGLGIVARVVEQSGAVPEGTGLYWGISLLALLVVLPIGAVSQLYRYRRVSTPLQRQQTKWVVIAFALIAFGYLVSVVDLLLPRGDTVSLVSSLLHLLRIPAQMLLPLTLTFAVLRYRLWDVDAILNRTIVYGLLTLTVLLIYGALVGGAGALFRREDGWLLPVGATALVALLFHPLRVWLQARVDQLLYGQRGDPLAVLRALGKQMEGTQTPEVQLQQLTATIAASLKLPWVGLERWSAKGDRSVLVASGAGRPATRSAVSEEIRFPLVYQGETLGALVVAPRAEGERLSAADQRMLETIALQAGPAIQAARLTEDLQESRRRIVATREEERRRLRRDLHDGLGPQLASQALTIDAILRQMEREPATARGLLLDLKVQSQNAIRDIRRIVHDLRPPALDDLGLVEALRESVLRTSQAGILATLEAPDLLPPLPAAVERAAFNIAQEALTNAVRHARPTRIQVCLALDEAALRMTVVDDGVGVDPGAKAGVGMHSMRERAAEVGGTLTIEPLSAGGTKVRALLPI